MQSLNRAVETCHGASLQHTDPHKIRRDGACTVSTFDAEWFCGRDESRPYTALFHFLQNLALFLQQFLNQAFQFVYLLLLALHCGLKVVFLGFQLLDGLDKDWAKS